MNRHHAMGCTLLEATFAVAILGMAFTPILGLFRSGTRVTRSTLDEVLTTNFATDALEQLETMSPAVLAEEATLSTADGTLADGASIPGTGGSRFHLAASPTGMTVSLTITKPSLGLRKIEIVAIRTEKHGAPLFVRLDTLVEGEESQGPDGLSTGGDER